MVAVRVFRATVRTLEERFEKKHVSGVGADAVFTKISIGWFVVFDEWPASMRVSSTKPVDIQPGDKIELQWYKVLS